MKLVQCPNCHAQYDADQAAAGTITCRCGTSCLAEAPKAKDAAVTRCASCGALLGAGAESCIYCGAVVVRQNAPAGPVCPQCYARNPAGARHCTSCGIAFQPQPIRDRAEPLPCPVCSEVRLGSRSLGGLWVDECPQCLGLWAPGDVMDRLVERVRKSRRQARGSQVTEHHERRAAWQDQVVYRHCPECGGTMQRKNFGGRSGVVLDWCGSHGTWLDAHEMEDVAAFVMEGGLEQTGTEGEMPADPARTAAILAAEQLLVKESAVPKRGERGFEAARRVWKGFGDLFDQIMK